MPSARILVAHRGLAAQIAHVVRDARRLVGWTQRELAGRAATSQATVWRLETGRATDLDLAAVERVLAALGIRAWLDLDARHLADRRRQQDGVHARLTGYIVRRLERCGWTTRTEVPIGTGAPRGWIDLLAYRPADRALLVEETKTDLPDLGALQRSLAFYAREARSAGRSLGWRPDSETVLCVGLDTMALGRRPADARDLVRSAFPVQPTQVAA